MHCERNDFETPAGTAVTTKMLLQGVDKMKNTLCQDSTQPYRWQPSCSSIDGSVLNIHHTALTPLQVTSIFSGDWRSILDVTDAKLMRTCKKPSQNGSVLQNKQELFPLIALTSWSWKWCFYSELGTELLYGMFMNCLLQRIRSFLVMHNVYVVCISSIFH